MLHTIRWQPPAWLILHTEDINALVNCRKYPSQRAQPGAAQCVVQYRPRMKCSVVVQAPAGVADAFVDMEVECCEVQLQGRSPTLLPQLTASSPRKTGAVTAISLEQLKESMLKILLLFGHNDNQVFSHNMLRSAMLGGPTPLRCVWCVDVVGFRMCVLHNLPCNACAWHHCPLCNPPGISTASLCWRLVCLHSSKPSTSPATALGAGLCIRCVL